jgi:hypothetical protein
VAAELARGAAAGLQAGGAVLGGPRGVEMVMAAGDRALALALLDGLSMRPGESGPASLRVSITHPELRRTPTWREHLQKMGVR